MPGRRFLVSFARAALVYLGVLLLSAPLVDWRHDDPTDEVEWVAISIQHWQQLTRGGPPAGLELERGEWRTDGPWRSGAQRTLFGYPSGNLPKLVWGAVLDAAGERSASAWVFDVFAQHDRAAGAEAERELQRALRIARGVTFAVFGLCATLLVLIACELFGGARGWPCAALALGLWLASPVTRASATFIRADYFMLACELGALLYALRARAALAGAQGSRGQLRAGLVLGLLSGLAVSAKLNGVFLAPIVALWLAAAWGSAPRAQRTPWARGLLAPVALAGLATCGVFYALHPRLWSEPLAGVADMLARWRWMRDFLHTDWALRANLSAAHGLGEGWSLFADRLLTREDPVRALVGLPLRWLLLPAGLVSLGYCALSRAAQPVDSGRDRQVAQTLLAAILVTALGTAAWLPIDWPRYWISAVALSVLVEAWLLTELAGRAARVVARRSRPSAA